jgi:hypothetical protein
MPKNRNPLAACLAFGTYRVMGEHLRVIGYADPRAQAA